MTRDMDGVEEHELEEFPASRRRAHSNNTGETLHDVAPDTPEPTLVGSNRSVRELRIFRMAWEDFVSLVAVMMILAIIIWAVVSYAIDHKHPVTHDRIVRRRSEVAARQITTFGRWGVEILYRLHRRAVLQVQWKWCMDNVCSEGQTLSVMCKKKTKDLNRFEKQECKWCWNDHSNKETTPLQRTSIIKHCNILSHRAASFLLVVCGLLLFLLLLIATILLYKLWSKRKAIQEASLPISASPTNHRAWKFWPFRALSRFPKSFEDAKVSNQLCPNVTRRQYILSKQSKYPRARNEEQHTCTRIQMEEADPSALDGAQLVPDRSKIPVVGAAVGSFTPLEMNNIIQRTPSQTDLGAQSGQRRSSRRSAASSGSEHISMTQSMTTTRRPSMREPGPVESGKDVIRSMGTH